MYFSIPDTTEVSAKTSSNQQSYTLFNIHINGIHHCSLRYSQLHKFNEELHRLLPTAMINIEVFPPKKFFSLSLKETEERRVLLEHYLQSIIQNKYITTSSYFNEFFLNAQCETFLYKSIENQEKVNIKICLLNNHEIIIENRSPNDNTSRLLDVYAAQIKLQQDFTSYFSLYLYIEKENQLNIFRPLYDFESPYISLEQTKKIHENCCIIFKKSYWDLNTDLQLIDDRRARNLLFVQAQYEIEQSQYLYSSDIYQQLEILRENNSFKDYLLLARTSKFYGHVFIRQCSILYPIDDITKQKLCQCLLAIGNNEIVCCLNLDKKKKNKEISFKVTRIRCWKVNRTKQETSIAMEYLIKKDNLQWITIHTEQAPLVSTCLQTMVDEILAKKAITTSLSTSATTTTEQPPLNPSNGLATRTESDLERLNNNDIFNRGDGDDDL
jgi:sorting nexin-17